MKRACLAVARVMALPENQVWGTWETIAPGLYVEGGQSAEVQPEGTHPPLVNLIAFEGRPPELLARVLETAAEVLCRELRVEAGNVYIILQEARSGLAYSGGRVMVRKT